MGRSEYTATIYPFLSGRPILQDVISLYNEKSSGGNQWPFEHHLDDSNSQARRSVLRMFMGSSLHRSGESMRNTAAE